MTDQANPLEEALLAAIAGLSAWRQVDTKVPVGTLSPDAAHLSVSELLSIFDAQVTSRHLDGAARKLRSIGRGFYTIGSSGHEGNAAVAWALRPTDPALLHYRSGGFYLARAAQVGGHDGIGDILKGILAAAAEPIAGGRHKVFGHRDLAVIPQTSTIASHLPRSVGIAFSIGRASSLNVPILWPKDSVVVCSFGDASVGHSTTAGAISTALRASYQNLPLPLLLVCEDNGLGISVHTPQGWIESAYGTRPGLRYSAVEGDDPVAIYEVARNLAAYVRDARRPAFLHIQTVRFGGHAGSDAEGAYRTPEEIRRDYRRDPILGTARRLVGIGATSPEELVERYWDLGMKVRERTAELVGCRTLTSASEVMKPLAPRSPERVAEAVSSAATPEARAAWFGSLPEDAGPMTLAQAINSCLADLLAARRELLVFGEDVATKGGVYGLTRGLLKKAGAARVFDTVLDEQSILGLALGAAVSGLAPVAEIQYLAYLHNAEDQLRGEAATLSFFSNGQYRNGMVIRVAAYGYQRGFGGHFHNDNALGVIRDIPGIVIASPARPSDAAAMLRTCVAAAVIDGTVTVFLEPIALYHTADLYEPEDGGWLENYDGPTSFRNAHIPIGKSRIYGEGSDVLLVTWANGLFLAMRAARRLEAEGIACRLLDLRWLAPLPIEEVARQAGEVQSVVIVDETRRTGGVGEGVVAGLVEHGYRGPLSLVASRDSFIPLGDAALTVLVSEDEIVESVKLTLSTAVS